MVKENYTQVKKVGTKASLRMVKDMVMVYNPHISLLFPLVKKEVKSLLKFKINIIKVNGEMI